MKLKYLFVLTLFALLTACVSDPKAADTASSTSDMAPQAQSAPAKAPQVQVNPNSPAFAKAQKSTQSAGQKGQTADQASQDYLAKKRAEKATPADQTRSKTNTNASTAKRIGPSLPSACSLLTEAFIGKVIGVDSDYISVKDGSGKSLTQRSCFFRWDHDGEANSGVLVQIQTNPLPDEFPDWASYYIAAKKNHGDKSADGSSTYRYKDFTTVGVSGAASYDLGRYYWRDAQDRVFMVAFNLPSNETEQLAWAETFAKEVTKNVK
jgi:membrane-bound lytic murein transglycosylase